MCTLYKTINTQYSIVAALLLVCSYWNACMVPTQWS